MSKIYLTYQRIIAYLKGLLSNRKRHDLEKEVMRDVFEEEAFEGLNLLSADELETDMQSMEQWLENRVKQPGRRIIPVYLRIAASIIMVMGLGSVIYFALLNKSKNIVPQEIAQEKSIEPSVEQDLDETYAIPETVAVEPETEAGREPEHEMNIIAQPLEKPETDRKTTQDEDQVYADVLEIQEETVAGMAAADKYEKTDTDRFEELRVAAAAPAPAGKPASKRFITPVKESTALKVFTARVVDEAGKPLPGVTVQEKGTLNGTITDADGTFTLVPSDTSSTFVLSFVGFKSTELPAGVSPDNEIMMQEDVLALEEVVVTGYNVEKKSDFTGAVSTIRMDDDLRSLTPTIEVTNPVPPNGTLRAFRRFVEDRLDYDKFQGIPGEYRIDATLTIQPDGFVKNIRIQDKVPTVIAEEYIRCITESPLWQPAAQGGIPIEAEVEIRFDLKVE